MAIQHQAGICWIKEDQWQRFLEVTEDADMLENDWHDWVRKTEEMIETFSAKGIDVVKVPVDVEELISWCHEKERTVNSSSRAEYVTKLMTGQPLQGDTTH
ncbi:hypothetical protein [Oceanospirillum linum]|uniref:Uncharacterized protein n=1 Tax=Oceanospirillum linum TaxID=966 RepID=A0A1T1HBF3_OCELI|nr:hypothetical protein [Oceanospirillum linum]OOV87057.1 hypothetical protein BTA35_0208600 [Oceanospirillum linum]SEF73104.1 hypothetical protein SAMN04489856_102117 [Oleiphilus messinensis]SMP16154.1 hypothetical protein SAMN06264348_103115 [Oceanospirillum linum]